MVFRTAYSRPYVFLLGTVFVLLAAAMVVLVWLPEEAVPLPVLALLSLVGALVAWMVFGTRFTIAEGRLSYRSGPFRGAIDIASISKIVYDDGLFKMSFMKIGCSHHGLMIHYAKFEDIYVSPEQRDAFVAALCQMNPSITVHR